MKNRKDVYFQGEDFQRIFLVLTIQHRNRSNKQEWLPNDTLWFHCRKSELCQMCFVLNTSEHVI